ncbi:MAG TPA: chorismate mutase [Longimicrobium sp.]|nr:chorismate mutase [Longimicrobium sp.]
MSAAAHPSAAAPAEARGSAAAEPRISVVAAEPTPAEARLAELRGRIQQIDRELIGLLAERVRVAREVGAAKRELGIPTLDPAREAAVVRNAGELARELGVGDEDVRYIFWHVIGLSRRAQMGGE